MRLAGFIFCLALPATAIAFVPARAIGQEEQQTTEKELPQAAERGCFVIGYPDATATSLDGERDVKVPFGAIVKTGLLDAKRIAIDYHGERLLIDCKEVLGQRDAHQFITELITEEPTADNYGFLTHVLHNMVQFRQAVEAADMGLALDPNHIECLAFRASSCFYLGDNKGAMETASRLGDIDAGHEMVHAVRSYVLSKKGQLESALESASKAIDARPDAYALWTNKGTILYRLKRKSESIAAYERSIELNPRAPFPYAYLGFHYYETGDEAETLKCFEKAVERRFPGYFPYMYLAEQARDSGEGNLFCEMAIQMAKCSNCPKDTQREYAWEMATSDDPNQRNGMASLEIADRLLGQQPVDPETRPKHLLLRAAALAELDRFADALETLGMVKTGYRGQQWEQMESEYQDKE